MASRFSAARPKRASEAFARAHHGEEKDDDNDDGYQQDSNGIHKKKVKFDVRNPSALAPSAQDGEDDDGEDEVLAADVIGGTRALKRGAVNIDGYDSDSDNENFDDRAEARAAAARKKKVAEPEDVDVAKAFDDYGAAAAGGAGDGGGDVGGGEGDDDDVDMFADLDADFGDDADNKTAGKKKKDKAVRFLDADKIEGQEGASRSGGRVHLDGDLNASSDDDDEDIEAAIAEEGIDEEVGAGGLKKHAPKIDAFNMQQEQEEGAFDEAGNYIRKAADENEVHDRWLEGLSKKDMKKAAAAHDKREAELRRKQREDDSILTSDLLQTLILQLEVGETALEALARIGKGITKPKKVPKWKQKKQQKKESGGGAEVMDVDTQKEPEDPKQTRLKESVNVITDAADKLLGRDYPNIYDTERERLIREYRKETGEDWVEPPAATPEETEHGADRSGGKANTMWEFRWVDGRDDAEKQGPFDGSTMKAWQDAGYFVGGVEFRPAEADSEWTKTATFV